MFLAWKEIRHQPLRFALIVAVIALMSYVTFFLAGLASGLAFDYRSAAERLGADTILLTTESNRNVAASRMAKDQADTATRILGEQGEPLVASPAVAIRDGERTDVYLFGLDLTSFAKPVITEGRAVADPATEVVVDRTIAEAGYRIGDELQITGSSHAWTIVGLTSNSTFVTLPVVHVDLAELQKSAGPKLPTVVNAILVKGDVDTAKADELSAAGLDRLTIPDFIQTLPGYSAQVLTFSMMIGALILIASLVLAIFIYVLTLQKRSMLGILKARGVPTSHLIASGAAQTTLLSGVGVLIGLGLTLLTMVGLPAKLPFQPNLLLYALITGAFVICAILGGLVSVRIVSTIDPVEAIA